MSAGSSPYSLGHSERERERLKMQAALYEGATLTTFRKAGMGPGMRVLDIGCGVGDVSFVLRRLVGEHGQVVGIDRSEEALAEARRRTREAGWDNVIFQAADCNQLPSGLPFDAIAGRLVLTHQPDPVSTLASLKQLAKPGTRFVFLEFDMGASALVSCPPQELFNKIFNTVLLAFEKVGVHIRMGAELYQTFLAAGLLAPEMHVEIPMGAGADWPAYDMLADIARSLLPAMEKFGIATAAEIRIDILADRLREECVRDGTVTMTPTLVGAWSVLK